MNAGAFWGALSIIPKGDITANPHAEVSARWMGE